jgi:hypothetical protein
LLSLLCRQLLCHLNRLVHEYSRLYKILLVCALCCETEILEGIVHCLLLKKGHVYASQCGGYGLLGIVQCKLKQVSFHGSRLC